MKRHNRMEILLELRGLKDGRQYWRLSLPDSPYTAAGNNDTEEDAYAAILKALPWLVARYEGRET